MTNEQVVQAWIAGHSGHQNLHFSTDGMELRSYGLLIGYTIMRKPSSIACHLKPSLTGCLVPYKVVRDFTKGDFISRTTSRHVNLAKRYADLVVKPKRTEADPEEVSNVLS